MPAPSPRDELARLEALRALAILDTPPEQAYDDAVKLAASACGTPIALVSLIDEARQWFKARVGLDVTETPRDQAFCAHAIRDPGHLLVVPDASRDVRFADNPLVTGKPDIRFYAGAPLVTQRGLALGTLCVIDRVPRMLAPDQAESLAALARMVVSQMELRRVNAELVRANAQLSELSFTDSLTGLPNRRALELRLAEEISRTQRHDGPLSLMLFDVDNFRSYNDEFGHTQGDDLLCCVAEILRHDLRQSDMVARYGGEQFVVVLPETLQEGACLLAERYRERIEAANFPGRKVTVSIGVAVWHPRFERTEEFMDAADQALYVAKSNGRNRVEVTSEIPHLS